jgi:acyl-coenzyme A thioesterase PaaI-like protein
MNLWPPFVGAGIRVRRIAPDWSEAVVELRSRWFNRNYVGTHFGGSLFAMTDPFYALLLMQRLGERYLVWDQAARIEFVAPGRGTVSARFELPEARVAEIRDRAGALVATLHKTLYVRLKPRYRPAT